MNRLLSLLERGRSMLRGGFARSAGGLSIATATGQAMLMLSLVLMDNLYTQDSIGIYSVFSSYTSIIQVVSLLAYPWCIPNIAEHKLRSALGLLLLLSCISSVLAVAGFGIAGYDFALELGVFTFGKSLVLIAEQVNIRQQGFRPIIASRLVNPIFFLAIIAAPWVGWEASASVLVWGHALCQLATGVLYAGWTLRGLVRRPPEEAPISRASMWQIAVEERKFLIYSTPAQLFNVLASSLPVILIEKYMSAALAAQYAVTLRAGMAPVTIIGGAVAQVYHGQLARIVRERLANGYAQFLRLRRVLLIGSLGVMLGTLVVLPFVVRWVLGPEWALAETLLQALAPMLGVTFVCSSLSSAFVVFEDQRFLLWHQLNYVVIALISFGVGIWLQDLVLGTLLFSALGVARYGWLYLRLDRLHRERLLPLDQLAAPSAAPSQEASAS